MHVHALFEPMNDKHGCGTNRAPHSCGWGWDDTTGGERARGGQSGKQRVAPMACQAGQLGASDAGGADGNRGADGDDDRGVPLLELDLSGEPNEEDEQDGIDPVLRQCD